MLHALINPSIIKCKNIANCFHSANFLCDNLMC